MSKPPTAKQRKQQTLSWKLRMVMGAKGNCSVYWGDRQMIPVNVRNKLDAVKQALDEAEKVIRHELGNIR